MTLITKSEYFKALLAAKCKKWENYFTWKEDQKEVITSLMFEALEYNNTITFNQQLQELHRKATEMVGKYVDPEILPYILGLDLASICIMADKLQKHESK